MRRRPEDEGSDDVCRTCADPGHCCRSVVLNQAFRLDAKRHEIAEWCDEMELPFVPERRSHYEDGGDGEPGRCFWLFSCAALDRMTGLCTIYENRPEPCRAYEAKSDPMCVHYDGPWEDWMFKRDG